MYAAENIRTYEFVRNTQDWYAVVPNYRTQGLKKENLLLVDGTRKLLNLFACGRPSLRLRLSDVPFDGADCLQLAERCEDKQGGAYYLLRTCHGQPVESLMWVCDISLLVFGDFPEAIYLRTLRS